MFRPRELSYALGRTLVKEADHEERNGLLATDDGMMVAAGRASLNDESSRTIRAVAANVYMEYKLLLEKMRRVMQKEWR
ncbi:hypothetical protein Pmar_PMAR004823 [Perkinsus marinus ATCC 50983]|uniref:Uncharacterized protein n=1 Tax=Perkinsus marinus (strain ATCC 50983 / TXsc) TaxID=423536 RepID=C5LLA1_PERM5|nr:hypothetical protein Pmar_PMAR004823 [Perkinsus marinus ATCC 50983]EER02460.1 hypothetical protein Pmar_PMAR004823 [Perkinsus marinus ATCC 50983]|eukprot:XP_002769742.1 hypothetical protein Pmar_PMAR004823 [Perkinsus marinus ATCC 50983]